jgi:hypothetical protein
MAWMAALPTGDSGDTVTSTQGEAALMASLAQTLDYRQPESDLQLSRTVEKRRRTWPEIPAVGRPLQLDPTQTERGGVGCSQRRRSTLAHGLPAVALAALISVSREEEQRSSTSAYCANGIGTGAAFLHGLMVCRVVGMALKPESIARHCGSDVTMLRWRPGLRGVGTHASGHEESLTARAHNPTEFQDFPNALQTAKFKYRKSSAPGFQKVWEVQI